MKVLSIIEPYASLIKDGKKLIETRGYKTSYRGELYIHASKTKIPNEYLNNKEVMDLYGKDTYNFGMILCKCKLVDCIYMTEEYVNNMKKNNYQEYICGKYEIGRYAWVLDDVEELNEYIPAKGNLNIWNYYTEDEIMNIMNNIDYGWMDKNNTLHNDIDESFCDNYILQTPKEILKNKIGVCWDQVELERYLFKNTNLNIETYFFAYYDGGNCPTHTFLTYTKNNKVYWFEHSWEKFRGIHEYNSIKELLLDVKNKFIINELSNDYIDNWLVLHKYTKPNKHLSVQEFYNHCDYGSYIDLNYIN